MLILPTDGVSYNDSPVKQKVQNRLGEIRNSRDLSAAELAKRVDVTRQTIHAIEAGTYVPNTEVALRLAHALEVSVETLFLLPELSQPKSESIMAEHLSSSAPERGQAVRVVKVGSHWVSAPASAEPYFLPEADGVVVETDGTSRKSRMKVLSSEAFASRRIVVAGCDPATSLLANMVERTGDVEVIHAPAPSKLALKWLKEGKVHIAGSHLEDPKTSEFNLPYIREEFGKQEVGVIAFAEWEEGFVVAPGNPKRIFTVDDLVRKGVRFVNRQAGSGSRALLDSLLKKADIAPKRIAGYSRSALGHLAAAYALITGDADCCLATRSAANAFGLDFVPLHSERYDFVFRKSTLDLPAVQLFMEVLHRAALRRKLETLAGYDTRKTGSRIA